ncbi:protein fantom [Genypterus blacodes]|uniref:protein fantom n=1 Tax=Genypterus blacodes TaxID=154954 RepID=UPI003F7734B0
MDETAGDLPVKDVGLMRGGLIPTVKDPQRLCRFPREHLEDLCLRLQEENTVLKQHTRTQEQRLRRMSTRLMRVLKPCPGSGSVKDRNMEDTIQELEGRVATLESQKGVLQNKLSLAKQHIMDLGGRTHYKFNKGKGLEGEGGVRRGAQTAQPRYGSTLEDTRVEMERYRSNVAEVQQVRVAELELTAQSLRDTLREREKEIEGTVREIRKQQADGHRITIRENVDLIRLQKQLSEKNTTLRVTKEKFTDLQEAYESQLEESQRSLKESQGALLEKVEELSGQLKQERQRTLSLEGQLTTASLSLQTQDKLQERISDLEGERDLLKDNYDSLLESTLSGQSKHSDQMNRKNEPGQKSQVEGKSIERMDIKRLEELLKAERKERQRLELELEKEMQRQEKQIFEEHKQGEQEFSVSGAKPERLEQEVFQYRAQVSTLQVKLDSVTKEFDMSVEELSETLLQIKAFRLQQESREGLCFLRTDGKMEDVPYELATIQALHAETMLELQKTRNLLLLEHRISRDLQEEFNTVNQKLEREREESRRRMEEKDQRLSKRALQINTLQAQLKELAYSPRNYKGTIPVQYIWSEGHQEVVQSTEDDRSFSQLKTGESLLEIHLKAATFTPGGLQIMGRIRTGVDGDGEIVSFCTYTLLDFEVHSTPLVSGTQPNFGFTSHYGLTARDLDRLGGQGSRVRVELHQAIGGIRFVTHGSGQMSLRGAMERRGERISGCVNITGSGGEMIGVVDFWVRLFPPAEPVVTMAERPLVSRTVTQRTPVLPNLGWQDSGHEELHDYGGGIPNELVVMLERCVSLSARCPGGLPDSYLTYRFYDMPPHVSPVVQCTSDPVFNDFTSYPLAVTTDVLHYLRSSSLWVYVFDDSDDQIRTAYLAKTPVPLRALSTGREIRGDYVLRDPAGGPRGMVRVMIKWKYPFHPPTGTMMGSGGERNETEKGRTETAEASQRPVAKPRVKTQFLETGEIKAEQKEIKVQSRPQMVKQRSSQEVRAEPTASVKPLLTPQPSPRRKRSTKRSPDPRQVRPHLTHEPRLTTSSSSKTKRQSPARLSRRSSARDSRTQDIPSVDQLSLGEEEEEEKTESGDKEASESSESSDIIIIPPIRKMRKGNKLRVEILSLSFEPSSHIALDQSVQRVYVEYRLLGVPMETTETPMSLRKPTEGEEIHYNFTRVIYVNGSQSAPLRQYLYTMMEGTDPNKGRLKFTVVSEPMDNDEECVDVGHAFLDLQELLLTGNDVTEQQIDIVGVDEDKEVIGNLKVSLQAAKALTVIYKEFQETEKNESDDQGDNREEMEAEDQLKVTDCDDDSDFN